MLFKLSWIHVSIGVPVYRFHYFSYLWNWLVKIVWFRWLKRWRMQTRTRRQLTGGFLTLVTCTRVNQLQQFSTLGMLVFTAETIIYLLYDRVHQTWNVKWVSTPWWMYLQITGLFYLKWIWTKLFSERE